MVLLVCEFVWREGSACCGNLSIREEFMRCGNKGNAVDVLYIDVCWESILLHDRQFWRSLHRLYCSIISKLIYHLISRVYILYPHLLLNFSSLQTPTPLSTIYSISLCAWL